MPQLPVADYPRMMSFIAELEAAGRVTPVGKAFGDDAWLLDGR